MTRHLVALYLGLLALPACGGSSTTDPGSTDLGQQDSSSGDEDVDSQALGPETDAAPTDPGPQDSTAPSSDGSLDDQDADSHTPPTSVTLTHLGTTEMVVGTHRPELFAVETEGASLLLAVVHPDGHPAEAGSIKHQAYRLTDDLEIVGEAFPLTTTTESYGEPADHRVLVVSDQLVVVYQTLRFDPDAPPPPGGPAEQYALDQSLMLARFTLTGEELFRGPIVANTTDFEADNFPDHCMAPDGESLIVSTGSSGETVTFRRVTLDGEITQTVQAQTSPETFGSTIGNSLFWLGDQLVVVSGQMMTPEPPKKLVFAALDDALSATPLGTHLRPEEDVTFPTGTLVHQGVVYLAYSAHEAGASPDIQVNPYEPRLAAFDGELALLTDEVVSTDPGAGHVHPTVAALGDTLYYAWSRKDPTGASPAPQVMLERYGIAAE
jgi:hypothetical protein